MEADPSSHINNFSPAGSTVGGIIRDVNIGTFNVGIFDSGIVVGNGILQNQVVAHTVHVISHVFIRFERPTANTDAWLNRTRSIIPHSIPNTGSLENTPPRTYRGR